MGRTAGGQVVQRRWKVGRGYALRFLAYGERHYLTLGFENEGWTRKRAEEELQNILADVRRGIWIPPDRARGQASGNGDGPEPEPSFHRFSSEWLAGRRGEVTERTFEFYEWALTQHLLPYFANWRLSEIDVEAVDAYRRFKVSQADQRTAAIKRGAPLLNDHERPLRPLSPASINKTIDVLQGVLALAVEYGHIERNPAAGQRRRLKRPVRRPVHLDTAGQIQALLDAAGELDARAVAQTSGRRVLIATLVLAGPRATEACEMRWRDIDLANGRIQVGRSKTQAGLREIPLLPLLRDELAAHKAASRKTGPDDSVFPTATGRTRDKDNIRNRVLEPVATRADELLCERGHSPLPKGLTAHKLRHTFASVLVACGEDPASVMAQLGHTDARFTLRVYAHVMRRDPAERERLQALVRGEPMTRRQVARSRRGFGVKAVAGETD
jgi:integrase